MGGSRLLYVVSCVPYVRGAFGGGIGETSYVFYVYSIAILVLLFIDILEWSLGLAFVRFFSYGKGQLLSIFHECGQGFSNSRLSYALEYDRCSEVATICGLEVSLFGIFIGCFRRIDVE